MVPLSEYVCIVLQSLSIALSLMHLAHLSLPYKAANGGVPIQNNFTLKQVGILPRILLCLSRVQDIEVN
jgi:hypothetical protein